MLPSDPANNDPFSATRRSWLLGALLLVASTRLWRLAEAGAPDFDSVRNWQIAQQLAHGDFSQLFHHGSPGFNLFYLPVALFAQRFLVFQTINALLGVAGLGFFAAWVSRKASLSGPEAAGLVLLGGTSLLLTFSGRDFTMSSLNLVLFAGLLRSHLARLQQPRLSALPLVALWLALGLSVDYKFLFTIPILVVLEWWQADGLWRQPRVWGRVLSILAAPYVLLGALGWLVGLPWYRWLAFYVRVALPKTANLAGRQATLQPDFLYYFRYLGRFESPLLLGLGLAAWLVLRQWRAGGWAATRQWPVLLYLLVWAALLLTGMSLVVKAPRGLLFAYLPLAALAVLSGRRVLPGWALAGVLLAAVGQNVFRIQQELFAPLPTHYPQVAAWLRQHGATRVASTVSLGLAPYLNKQQTLTVVTDERQLATLRRQGVQYVLLDGYRHVAGVARFDSLQAQRPVAAWPEPPLHRPLLFLEHSEFTGLGYAETLAACQAARADSLPLRLYRLQ
ncbi:xanthosine utilization system XapX-like protein [Hymenobacter sp. UYAg731]